MIITCTVIVVLQCFETSRRTETSLRPFMTRYIAFKIISTTPALVVVPSVLSATLGFRSTSRVGVHTCSTPTVVWSYLHQNVISPTFILDIDVVHPSCTLSERYWHHMRRRWTVALPRPRHGRYSSTYFYAPHLRGHQGSSADCLWQHNETFPQSLPHCHESIQEASEYVAPCDDQL